MLPLEQLGTIAEHQVVRLLAGRHRAGPDPNAELALRLLILLLRKRLEAWKQAEDVRSNLDAAITALDSAQREMLALHRQDRPEPPEITRRVLAVKHTVCCALDVLQECEDSAHVSFAP